MVPFTASTAPRSLRVAFLLRFQFLRWFRFCLVADLRRRRDNFVDIISDNFRGLVGAMVLQGAGSVLEGIIFGS